MCVSVSVCPCSAPCLSVQMWSLYFVDWFRHCLDKAGGGSWRCQGLTSARVAAHHPQPQQIGGASTRSRGGGEKRQAGCVSRNLCHPANSPSSCYRDWRLGAAVLQLTFDALLVPSASPHVPPTVRSAMHHSLAGALPPFFLRNKLPATFKSATGREREGRERESEQDGEKERWRGRWRWRWRWRWCVRV